MKQKTHKSFLNSSEILNFLFSSRTFSTSGSDDDDFRFRKIPSNFAIGKSLGFESRENIFESPIERIFENIFLIRHFPARGSNSKIILICEFNQLFEYYKFFTVFYWCVTNRYCTIIGNNSPKQKFRDVTLLKDQN